MIASPSTIVPSENDMLSKSPVSAFESQRLNNIPVNYSPTTSLISLFTSPRVIKTTGNCISVISPMSAVASPRVTKAAVNYGQVNSPTSSATQLQNSSQCYPYSSTSREDDESGYGEDLSMCSLVGCIHQNNYSASSESHMNYPEMPEETSESNNYSIGSKSSYADRCSFASFSDTLYHTATSFTEEESYYDLATDDTEFLCSTFMPAATSESY